MHNYSIKNKYYNTLKVYLRISKLFIPHHWGDNDMDIFDKAIFGIYSKLDGHKPDERNEQGFTVAMI